MRHCHPTLSVHDALRILLFNQPVQDLASKAFLDLGPGKERVALRVAREEKADGTGKPADFGLLLPGDAQDRKSTRLNSSHEWISYAAFSLKTKTQVGP